MAKHTLTEFDLYKQMIERMPVHIYWKDTQFRYITCNSLQAKDLGFTSSSEIINKTDYDIFPRKQADKIRENDMQIISTGMPGLFEEEGLDSEGNKSIYLTQKIPLFNKKGEIVGLAGLSVIITERKAHEEKVRQEKEEVELTLAGILDYLPGHVYWKNKDSVYQGCNLAQAQSAGFSSPKDMVGKTDNDMPWRHEASILRESDLAVMKSGETLTREEASQLANSDEVSIFLSKKSPLLNKAGEVIGIMGISFDITDRKKIEEALHQSQIAAEAANQAKSEFIRNMEHQLRTPFSGVYSLVELMSHQESDPEKKEMLELTYQSAKEFLDLLDNIIDFSRGQLDSDRVLAKKFDLKETLARAITMEKAAALVKHLPLTFSYPNNLPTIFIGDPYRINRLILNLLGNAIKFTHEGSIDLQVDLLKQIDDKNLILKIVVSDTGIGIPEEKQRYIYEKFYRLHPANQNTYKGAGLGLYVVKQIINELDGEIDVLSSPKKGTRFICTLPFKRPLVDELLS